MSVSIDYYGPQCPRCGVTIALESLRTGTMICDYCQRPFEATAFQPPQRRQVTTEVVGAAGPEGANACANHVRNAAVTSCLRCGLFICSLCDMNIGAGSYCPSCFDRVRAEGTVRPMATKYRDYAAMARLTAILGMLVCYLWAIPGAIVLYLAPKAFRQRREQGKSTVGMVFIVILGILEILASVAIFGFLIWAMLQPGGLK